MVWWLLLIIGVIVAVLAVSLILALAHLIGKVELYQRGD
ncbi:MAG: hypothetical protein UX31_C0006G0075 [Candidatus Nomurabacteria bacterium GW2011_GWA1_46_11]|uniref:Uncharacterized protein n=1 Tax=Candidatus Nomurabacteria bacterium GW2011_GWA1_46_11 TaxID=1618732 RepID=A0A0G1QWK4_9BACT|nr:MAG: hypothetical protein UX29_C0008G0042 [Parcubacteria group bacterium GW2011_GWA2_46_10]KKU22163.1 MAG: hypothetical protein UX31_C0006G0075 [Candidatus Nomurabacteria bacterium GW2011_GWA1_46_11]